MTFPELRASTRAAPHSKSGAGSKPCHDIWPVLHQCDAAKALCFALRAIHPRGFVKTRKLRVEVRLHLHVALELERVRQRALDL